MTTVPCQACGAPCELRRSAKGRAWYRCDGAASEKACQTICTFGPRPSRALLDQDPPADDPTPAAAEPAADDRPRLLI